MEIFLNVILLVIGFVLLIKGADVFVDSASAIAKRLRIPSMVIGLTIVSIGTSLPEASVSISGALMGANEIAVSNVIGSNIFNILIVAGVSAVLRTIPIEKSTLKADFPICIAATILMVLMMTADGLFASAMRIGRIDGIILVALMISYIAFLVRTTKQYQAGLQEETYTGAPLWKSIIFAFIGIGAIALGGDLTVEAAKKLAASFGMSETLIGLTIIAMGTSLPELATSIIAVRKGENDIAIGNVIGSNIFNILFVLGLSAVLSPLPVSRTAVWDSLILTAVMFISYALSYTGRKISKKEGALMIMLYIIYTVYIIIRN